MDKTEAKPVIDNLQPELNALKEQRGIIIAKLKRWQNEIQDKKTAVMLTEIINKLEGDGLNETLIGLVAMVAQTQIHDEKKKAE